MNYEKILQLPNINSQLKDFLEAVEDFEISIKKLDLKEIERFLLEYPNLFDLKNKTIKKLTDEDKNIPSILCLTLVKKDPGNYVKLRKLKMYIDESNGEIIKILQN